MNLNLTVGKVPGTVKQITISTPATVFAAMKTAADVCSFSFSRDPYSANGKEMVDVPFLNGRELAIREGDKICSVLWDTEVTDGDIVLLVPKIRGNQFLVTVAKVPGQRHTVALLHSSEPEATEEDGTVINAIQIAGVEFNSDFEVVFVNGESADSETVLNDGDEVTISEKISVATSEIFEEEDGTETTVIDTELLKVKASRDKKRLLFIFK